MSGGSRLHRWYVFGYRRGKNYVTYINLWWWENCCGKDAANCGKCVGAGAFTGKLETFENGEEFLKQYVIRDDELVILDLDMPVKNGIDDLTGAWKNSEKWSRDSSHSVW